MLPESRPNIFLELRAATFLAQAQTKKISLSLSPNQTNKQQISHSLNYLIA